MRGRDRSERRPGDPLGPDTASFLRASAAARGITLNREQIDRLERFLEVLLEWRETTSLVAQRDLATIVSKHVEDAFAVVPLLRDRHRVADLGTGAGFPGMILAIVCPGCEVLLVESKRRKASYLRDSIRRTGTVNARVLETRAEKLTGELEGRLDAVVSRAVWPGNTFFEVARPLLRVGGMAISMKTRASDELARPTGYGPARVIQYALSRAETRLLIVAEAC